MLMQEQAGARLHHVLQAVRRRKRRSLGGCWRSTKSTLCNAPACRLHAARTKPVHPPRAEQTWLQACDVAARRHCGTAAAPAAACANNLERLLRSLARCLTREGEGSGCGVDDPDAAAPETVISLAAAAAPDVRAVKSTPDVWGGREKSINSTVGRQPDALS